MDVLTLPLFLVLLVRYVLYNFTIHVYLCLILNTVCKSMTV
uniref:Uncharacterized protein n=1 Tax=Arundo donax TaxID=35708 RepID=A0A0A9G003_ARUDO